MWRWSVVIACLLAAGIRGDEHISEASCDNDSCGYGTCDQESGTCICHPFYTGERCDMQLVTPCGDYYCFNGGLCMEDEDGMSYCACEDPYFGDYCLYQPEPCYCLNGGYGCDNLTDYNGTCTCPEGFTGSHCETEICSPECPANAYCCNGSCQCYPGYSGENCTEVETLPWEQCAGYYCFNNGTCENDTCQCQEPFEGPYCLIDTSLCDDEMMNASLPNSDNCTEVACDSCEIPCDQCMNVTTVIDYERCGSYYCLNGGNCVNDTCECLPDTQGTYCEFVNAPSSPPDNLTLSNSTYNSATFEWSLPLGLSQLLGIWYIVEVQENSNITTTTETSCPSLTLTLNPNTQYCLRVLGAVSGGYSPWSTQLCIDAPDVTLSPSSPLMTSSVDLPEESNTVDQPVFTSVPIIVTDTFEIAGTTTLISPSESIQPSSTAVEPQQSSSEVEPQPSSSEVEPQPSSSEVEPQPSSSEVELQPSSSEVEPQPSSSNVEPQPSSSEVELQPSSSEVEPQPSSSEIEPQPSSSEVEPQPSSSEVEPQPSSSEVEPQPSSSEVEPQPSSSEVEPQPSSSEVEPQPSSEVEPQPSSSEVEPQPSSSEVEPQPSSSEVEPEPSSSEVEPQPSSSEVEPQPSSSEVEPQPSSSEVEPQPSSSEVEPQPSSSEIEPQPSSSEVEPQPSSSEVEPQPSSSQPSVTSTSVASPSPSPEVVFCNVLREDVAGVGIVEWPRTEAPNIITDRCNCSNQDIDVDITKMCNIDGTWDVTNTAQCTLSVEICSSTTEEVFEMIDVLAGNASTVEEVETVVSVLDSLGDKVDNNTEAMFFDAVDEVFSVDAETLEEASEDQPIASKIEDALVKAGNTLPNTEVKEENFELKSMMVDPDDVPEGESLEVSIESVAVDLPSEVLQDAETGNNEPVTVVVVEVKATVVFMVGAQLSSTVTIISVGALTQLTIPIRFSFADVQPPADGMENKCGFFDRNANGGLGGWSNMGVRTISSGGRVMCESDHLTAFGIYQVPIEASEPPVTIATGLSVGAIAGIAVAGVVAMVIVLGLVIIVLCYTCRQKKKTGSFDFPIKNLGGNDEVETVENDYALTTF